MTALPVIHVVAGLIARDTRILICQRRRDDPAFPLKWEFPGGKMLPEETPQQALRRELREELGVDADVGAELFRVEHTYTHPPRRVEITFLSANLPPGEVHNLAFEQVRWVISSGLIDFDFLEADRAVVQALAPGRSSF